MHALETRPFVEFCHYSQICSKCFFWAGRDNRHKSDWLSVRSFSPTNGAHWIRHPYLSGLSEKFCLLQLFSLSLRKSLHLESRAQRMFAPENCQTFTKYDMKKLTESSHFLQIPLSLSLCYPFKAHSHIHDVPLLIFRHNMSSVGITVRHLCVGVRTTAPFVMFERKCFLLPFTGFPRRFWSKGRPWTVWWKRRKSMSLLICGVVYLKVKTKQNIAAVFSFTKV